MRSAWIAGFGRAVEDVRAELIDRGWFGKPVPPRAASLSIEPAGDRPLGEQFGWTRPGETGRGLSENQLEAARTKDPLAQREVSDLGHDRYR